MESTPKLLGFLLMLWITASAKAHPDPSSKNEVSSSKNIVGVASQIITNALIQGQADSKTNYAFSPVGYATILSILGQGSVGQTRSEIFKVLEQPENEDEVRKAYRMALTEFSGNDSVIAPQFKTWFYIYRNNTAEESFKKILLEDYLVEIKDIDRIDFDFDTTRAAEETNSEKSPENGKDVVQFEDLKTETEQKDDFAFETVKLDDGSETIKLAGESMMSSENFADFDPIIHDDAEKFDQADDTTAAMEQAIADYDQLNKDEKIKVSKFDKHVDDTQYVEVPEIKKEVEGQVDMKSEKEHLKQKLERESDGPEKITLPLKKYSDESGEIMEAQENRNFVSRFGRAQPLHLQGDVTSALSGNSIVGKKEGDSSEGNQPLESKMLLFNGLYFRGNWAQPFMELRTDETKFFNAMSGKQDVKFMTTHGSFKYAEITSKKLIAVELPYKNERYSLMIVMPNSDQDLKQYSKESNYNSLNEIVSQLEPTDINLMVPKFRFECTSRAEKALGKLGLTTLFTSKADLKRIYKDALSYQIQELVQHVAIRVDEGSSSESALSAGNVEGRNNVKFTEVFIDKPFLFYVRDVVDEIVLTAGKIVEVPVDIEIPITFN